MYSYNNESELTQKDIYKNGSDSISEKWGYSPLENKIYVFPIKSKYNKWHSDERQFKKKGKRIIIDYKTIDIRYKQEHVIMRRQEIRNEGFELVSTSASLLGKNTPAKLIYTYNKEGFVREIDAFNGDELKTAVFGNSPTKTSQKSIFEYEYDANGNWIQRINKTDDGMIVTTIRKIFY